MRLRHLPSFLLLPLAPTAVLPQAPVTEGGGMDFDNVMSACEAPILLPEPGGHHQVGVMEYHWPDHSREEWLSEDPDDDRQVMASIYYPALRVRDGPRAPYVPELDVFRQGFRSDSREFPQQLGDDFGQRACVLTSAFPDLPVDEMGGPFPVAVFSPGGNMSRHWYTGLAQDLASEGWVVAALSHAYSGMDVFPRGGFTMSAPEFDGRQGAAPAGYLDDIDDRLADVLADDASFALDQLAEMSSRGPFSGRLDLERVALLGHSRGGTTVGRACSTDPRFGACVVYDNIGPSPEIETGLDRPQLSVRRPWSRDRTARLHAFLEKNRVVAYDVVIDGVVHNSFSDLSIVDPEMGDSELSDERAHAIITDVTLAFLDRHIRGIEGSVTDAAARYPEATNRAFGTAEADGRGRPDSDGDTAEAPPPTATDLRFASARALADSVGTDAFLLLIDGRVIARYGDVAREYRLHSIRKSLLSTLYGVALDDEAVDTAKTLAEVGIDDQTPLTATERTATVRDLLMSRSGVFLPATHENPAWDDVRPERSSHAPGSYWMYNNWDFNAAGTAYQIMTGESVFHAFRRDIARPIGMEDFRVENGAWRYGSRSRHPAYVFRMSARDLARFGQLMLQEGRWQGRQVVPADWIRHITESHSRARRPEGSIMDDTGYGLMWWIPLERERHGVELGPGSFVASGTGTQLLVVAPALDLVFVHRNDTDVPSDEYRSVSTKEAYEILVRLLEAL